MTLHNSKSLIQLLTCVNTKYINVDRYISYNLFKQCSKSIIDKYKFKKLRLNRNCTSLMSCHLPCLSIVCKDTQELTDTCHEILHTAIETKRDKKRSIVQSQM